jgi:IS30 family transposase
MDTVIGLIDDKKCLLTLHFPAVKFMLIYLIDSKTSTSVVQTFYEIQKKAGIENFKKLFPTILTDRGIEFISPESIEFAPDTGEYVTRVFYCDAMASHQKGAIENNHRLIRRIFPKGTSTQLLNKEKVSLIVDHINSYVRDTLDNLTPYEAFKQIYGQEILDLLEVKYIEPNSVIISSRLLSK